MVGYGVTNKPDPSKMVQNNVVAMPEPIQAYQPLQPKRELTLQEKQQLASTFENSGNLMSINNAPSKSYSTQRFSNNSDGSRSSDLLADSFMNSNLSNLSLSCSQQKQPVSQLSIMNGPMPTTNSTQFQQPFQQPMSTQFNVSNQKPAASHQMNFNNPASSGNMGFFGNLAIGGPTGTSSSSSQMNNQIPNLKPPPMMMTPLKIHNNSANVSQNKSALDDLNDIFG